jgi:hypothetical protein
VGNEAWPCRPTFVPGSDQHEPIDTAHEQKINYSVAIGTCVQAAEARLRFDGWQGEVLNLHHAVLHVWEYVDGGLRGCQMGTGTRTAHHFPMKYLVSAVGVHVEGEDICGTKRVALHLLLCGASVSISISASVTYSLYLYLHHSLRYNLNLRLSMSHSNSFDRFFFFFFFVVALTSECSHRAQDPIRFNQSLLVDEGNQHDSLPLSLGVRHVCKQPSISHHTPEVVDAGTD